MCLVTYPKVQNEYRWSLPGISISRLAGQATPIGRLAFPGLITLGLMVCRLGKNHAQGVAFSRSFV